MENDWGTQMEVTALGLFCHLAGSSFLLCDTMQMSGDVGFLKVSSKSRHLHTGAYGPIPDDVHRRWDGTNSGNYNDPLLPALINGIRDLVKNTRSSSFFTFWRMPV